MNNTDKSLTVRLRDGSTFTAPGQGQLYTFSRDGHEDLVFCVPKLIEMHAQHPEHWETIEIPLIPEDARMIDETRGINMSHLRRMPRARMEEPGIAVFMQDGSFLLVDGNHRYLKRINAGRETMVFHTCRPPTWEAALLDVPATRKAWESKA
jgi:hypothetical protein